MTPRVMPAEEKGWTEQRTATYLGLSVAYLRNVRYGRSNSPAPKPVKLGRSVRYDADDVRAFWVRMKAAS